VTDPLPPHRCFARRLRRAVLGVLTLGLLIPSIARPTGSPAWPGYRGGSSLTGLAAADLASPLVERWRVRIGSPLVGAPVADAGSAFALTEDGELVAVTLDGRERWRTMACREPGGEGAQGRFLAPPLLVGDAVLVGSNLGTLCALGAGDGQERWRYALGGPISASPGELGAPGEPDWSVLVSSQSDGAVHRLDPTSGRRLASSEPSSRCDGGVSVGDGVVAFGNCDAALFTLAARSLEPRGQTRLLPEGEVAAGVAIRGGTMFAGDRSGRVYAASVATGELLWVSRDAGGEIGSAPAVSDTVVVVATRDGVVVALERSTGQLRWRKQLGGSASAPVITTGGQVIVGAGGVLHLLAIVDGSLIRARPVSDGISAPAVVNGLVLLGTEDGFLVALGAPPSAGGTP
jgi:outer membrane protein assembly factor BamB